jgi:peptide/nickel transport system substrate-binding protein
MEKDSYWQRYWTRRLGRRQFLRYAAGGAGTLAFLAACRQEEAAPPPQQTPAAPRAPTAGQGGTLVLHDNGDPASFDYYKTWSYRTMIYMSMVYPKLLKFKVGPGVGPLDFDIVPDLAVAMPEQPDATTYIFKLRPAKWENKPPLNGRALTAEDVVKNWDRFKAEHPNRSLLVDVDRVEATAPDTVRFVLSRPLGPFINHIGHQGMFYIMPYELFGTGQLEKDMWSAGPFLFRGYQVGAEVRFEWNPNFYIPDRPRPNTVIYRLIPDTSTTISQLRTKQIDSLAWTAVVGAKDLSSLKSDLPGATFTPYDVQGNSWIGFDLRDPVFQDKRVRQAISMAINRDDLVKVSEEGRWALPYGVLDKWYFDPKKNEFPNARYYQYNLNEAKALLQAAGHTRLGPYDMIASAVWTPEQLQTAQLIQQQLRAVGIETNLKQLPFAEYYAQTVIGGRWQGAIAVSSNLVGADPNEYFSLLWNPDSPRLIAPGLEPILRQDTELMSAIERQRREVDPNRRREAIREVVNIMADRMYNVPHVVPRQYHVHQANVYELHWIFTYAQEYLLDAFKA